MADMHVLVGGGNKWRVVMHFLVPDENNSVAVSYRAALVASGLGGTTSMAEGVGAGQITAAEKAQIEAGEVLEQVELLSVESGGTAPAQLRAAIRKLYASVQTRIIDQMKKQLRYFGHTESKD